MQESNLDFDIIEFNDDLLDDNNLSDKIESINETEEINKEDDDEDHDSSLVNPDLIDENNIDDLDLNEEEKQAILNKKKEAASSKEEDEESSDEDDEENSEVDPLKIFASELQEKNLLNLPEDWDGSEDALFEAYEATLDERALNLVKSSYKIDDPRVDGVLNFLKHGGNIDDYINLHAETNWVDVDIEDEDNATALVKTYLTSVKNLEEEEAESLLDGYKEKGKLFNQASKIQADLKVFREKQEDDLIKSQQEYARIQREEYIKSVNKIRQTIQSGKSDNVVIAKNQKSNFEDFIFSPQEIRNDKGEVVGRATGFKQKLNEYLSDPEKMVALAYKIFEGLSDKSDKIEVASKEKSKLAESLRRASGKTKPNTIKLEFIN
jgi:hypothetical protein